MCLRCRSRRLIGGATGAFAQDKTFELKLSHWVPPSHPLQKALEEWGASVEKDSGGTIKYKVYPAQQLGKAFDHYDMARDGIADLTYINPGYQPGRFPIIGAGELPFLMANAKGGSQALDAWYRKYAAKEMKDVKFCLAFVHDPGAFHSRSKKIVVPADIKGMKIRPAHATMATFVTQLGGTNVQARAPEVRDILEKGVADAVTFPWGSVAAVRHRQGDQVSHGRAALRDHLRLRLQQGQIRSDVGGAEEGDRQPLHHRMGAEGRRHHGPTSSTPASPSSRRRPATRSMSSTPGAAGRMEEGRRAAGGKVGRGRQEGRRRSGRCHEGAQGAAVQGQAPAY